MIGEMETERRIMSAVNRAASRIASTREKVSIDENGEGGYGLRRVGDSRTALRKGGGDDENQLYAEYLRSFLVH